MDYRLQISAQQITWPGTCACCGDLATKNVNTTASKAKNPHSKRHKHVVSQSWSIPYCDECAEHVTLSDTASLLMKVGIIGGIIISIFMWFIGIPWAILFIVLSVQKKKAAQRRIKPNCSSVKPAVVYHGWYQNTHSFSFVNKSYYEMFIQLNNKKKIFIG